MVRSFIAVPLNTAVQTTLAGAIGVLAKAGAKVKWVDPARAHVTLKFLGDISDDQVAAVAEGMGRAAQGVAPFPIGFAGVGIFPASGRPSVLWVGLKEKSPPLSHLHDRMEQSMEGLGLAPETRRFSPHITLGRVRGSQRMERLLAAIAGLAETEFGTLSVARVLLMMSTLTPRGAEYAVLSTAVLR